MGSALSASAAARPSTGHHKQAVAFRMLLKAPLQLEVRKRMRQGQACHTGVLRQVDSVECPVCAGCWCRPPDSTPLRAWQQAQGKRQVLPDHRSPLFSRHFLRHLNHNRLTDRGVQLPLPERIKVISSPILWHAQLHLEQQPCGAKTPQQRPMPRSLSGSFSRRVAP